MRNASGAGSGTVLLVEDDEQVRGFIRSLLTNDGYEVLEARTGADGLAVAMKRGADIDLLLSDMLLPELSGFDLAQGLRGQFPDMKVLFITGYVEGDIVQRCLGELGAGFLDKPFQPSVLLSKVREAIPTRGKAVTN
jgi:two-component system cell cycle sensor histidine kinase/response regulator CckA